MNTYTELDIQNIEKESNALIVKANDYQITSDDIYVKAMLFAKDIKGLIKEVKNTFDPIVSKANAAWKESIAQRDKHLNPLQAALEMLDKKGRVFRIEQERVRQEEERKARELEQKEAEKLQRRADKAQAQGKYEKAQELSAKAQEVASITPVIASKVSKVEGIKIRKIWKAEVTDMKALVKAISEGKAPITLVEPNKEALRSAANTNKDTLQYPGVRFYQEECSI